MKPISIDKDTGISDECKVVRLIFDKYKVHSSVLTIIQIKSKCGTFHIPGNRKYRGYKSIKISGWQEIHK